MFKNLLNLAYTRNLKEAFGFYVAYLLLFLIVGMIIGGVIGGLWGGSDKEASDLGSKGGGLVAIVAPLGLSMAILYKKKLLGNFLYLTFALMGAILSMFGGGLLGLIPTAFFTTRPPRSPSTV